MERKSYHIKYFCHFCQYIVNPDMGGSTKQEVSSDRCFIASVSSKLVDPDIVLASTIQSKQLGGKGFTGGCSVRRKN